MTRRKLSLPPPPEDPRRLEGFPRSNLDPREVLWRVVSEGFNPWWFSSAMTGRFDLEAPDGTCYLAADELTAVLEVFGPDREEGTVTTEELRKRRLFRLQVPERHSLADLTSRRAAGFGMTHEIHSHARNDLTQAWARSLRDAGTEGLRYLARHDPSPGECVALFGRSGEHKDWDPGSPQRLEQPRLVDRLWQECRIRVVDRPRRDEIPMLE